MMQSTAEIPVFILAQYTLLWLGFAALHSGMATLTFRRWFADKLGYFSMLERAIYNLVSLLATLGLMTYAHSQIPAMIIFQPEPLGRTLLALFQGCGLIMLIVALRSYDLGLFSGIGQIKRAIQARSQQEEPFKMGVLHRYIRHPLYASALIILWCRPLDLDSLATNLLASLYFIIGLHFEERKLKVIHGAVYIDYCQKVPALVPRSIKPRFSINQQ
ncbi:MAG: hypothetical protein HQL54_02905 [Magnetococcales bacterium]|nr:hypothetical protein [Magnetococcales bacterium]